MYEYYFVLSTCSFLIIDKFSIIDITNPILDFRFSITVLKFLRLYLKYYSVDHLDDNIILYNNWPFPSCTYYYIKYYVTI